jgi:hypothetical protein
MDRPLMLPILTPVLKQQLGKAGVYADREYYRDLTPITGCALECSCESMVHCSSRSTRGHRSISDTPPRRRCTRVEAHVGR